MMTLTLCLQELRLWVTDGLILVCVNAPLVCVNHSLIAPFLLPPKIILARNLVQLNICLLSSPLCPCLISAEFLQALVPMFYGL